MRPKENVPVARAERNLSRDILPRDVSSGFCRHEAGADGVAYEPRHIVDIQPVHQFAAMCVNGLHAQLQLIGDVFCRAPFGNDLQHFTLSRGQVGEREGLLFPVGQIILDQVIGDTRT